MRHGSRRQEDDDDDDEKRLGCVGGGTWAEPQPMSSGSWEREEGAAYCVYEKGFGRREVETAQT